MMRSLIAAAVIAAATVGTAYAAGGSSSGSTAPIVCKKGWVYSQSKQICVQASSGLVDDKQLYEQGHALAKTGHYAHALAALEAIENKNDSMVLTMIGYSKRKMGQVNEGIAFYHKALAVDPTNVNTREYLGEGYVSMGRKDLAVAELDKIEKLSGVDSEQYVTLASFIANDGQLETAW